MAKRKSESEQYINIYETAYLRLIKAYIPIEALKVAGIRDMLIYQVAKSIIDDGKVEIHLHSIHKRYK